MGNPIQSKNDLATTFPQLAKEWHPSRNGDVRPQDVSTHSRIKVWWLAPCGHEWQASPASRTAGGHAHGCPICAGRLVVSGINDLATIYPEVAAEWDVNGNGGLTPQMVAPKSNKRVSWRCKNGHVWVTTVVTRTAGRGCPICSGNKVLPGFNDLASKEPQLVKYWHPTRNGNLTPQMVSYGSNKTVWWIDEYGHEWEASISSRVRGYGCPYCAGNLPIEGETDLATVHPELVNEWDNKKNRGLAPRQVTSGSSRKVWWRCPKDHVWKATVASRCRGNGCPYCSNKCVLSGFNDLATTHPDLAREWDYERNKGLTPRDVVAGSSKKVWWKCAICGGEWQAILQSRSKNNHGCPYCSGHKVLAGFNDLATLFPDIAAEWDFEKNGALTPRDVTKGSIAKVWWRCKKGHSWQTTVNVRTFQNTGCPICNGEHKTSFPEQAVLYYLRRDSQTTVTSRVQVPVSDGTVEVDVWLPELHIGVEYEGAFWHAGREWHDERKMKALSSSGVSLYRIIESDHEARQGNDLYYDVHHNKRANLSKAIGRLEQLLGIQNSLKIDADTDEGVILEQYKHEEAERSLLAVRPDLAEQWDDEKNGGRRPDQYSFSSMYKAWWKCEKGHVWRESINRRSNPNRANPGCPYCSNKRLLTGFNDLKTRYPDIASEWHPNRNLPLTSDLILAGSHQKVWWLCPACGYEYQAPVASRTGKKASGCPACAGRAINPGVNDLASVDPALASQWHPTLNKDLSPQQVTPSSKWKVWWLGPCGHEWQATVANRTNGGGCPYCQSRAILVGFNDLATTSPNIAREWNQERNGGLKPTQVMSRSGKKVWWKCSHCGHEWQAVIANRTPDNGTRCPKCKQRP